MPLPPRRPAIVGAAQTTQRLDDPREAEEPLALMERSLRAAAEDAGAPKLLEALDAVYTPQGTWKYGNPGQLLADRVGAGRVATGMGVLSGHIVQVMVDHACREIAEGRRDVVAVVGGESENSKRRLKKSGDWPAWDDEVPGEPDRAFGDYKAAGLMEEYRAGVSKPTLCFALCETALRAHRGESPAQHRRRIAELESRMSAVAAKNPHAWIQREVSAEEIATPTPANRMVSYPYTKLMTSNIAVDQSAALILCSEEAAARFGVRQEGRVYLRHATEMSHVALLMARPSLHEHRGMHIAGERLLERAGVAASELAHVDLYSCFPFAVQAGAAALGLDETRPLSVTGGLTFSGGPFGNYVLQAKARMVEVLRDDPGALGVIGSVGGNFAKFAFGLYSTDPGEADAPDIVDVGDEFAPLPRREFTFEHEGPARAETYAVDVHHDGPHEATFFALDEKGTRVLARTRDRDVMQAILDDEDFVGREARVNEGAIHFS